MPRRDARPSLPYGPKHWLVFAAGLGSILMGYVFLSIGPATSVSSLTIGPILLVFGYCILIPMALLGRFSDGDRKEGQRGSQRKRSP